MLNIDFLKEDKGLLEVRVWVEKKSNASDVIQIYPPEQIKEFIEKEIKKRHKDISSYVILTEVQKIKNKMPSHRHSQNLKIQLNKKQKKTKKVINHKES
tara:strand:- start:669 stop:965 length:297 start_codon:yes stop_codon:yes gene_type:complete